ncbi:MAG: hypothetical protein WCL00_14050 [Bacteroidota bacterium]
MFYNLNSYVFKSSTTLFQQAQKTMSPRWGSGNVLHVSFYKDITPLGFQDYSDISRFFFTKSISTSKVYPQEFLLIRSKDYNM